MSENGDAAILRCGAETKSGTHCRNRVSEPGQRCRLHQGAPAEPVVLEEPVVLGEFGVLEEPALGEHEPGGQVPDADALADTLADAIRTDEEPPAQQEPAQQEPAPPPDPRLVRAAARCEAAIAAGALDAVDALATPYVGEAGWASLRQAWRRENCGLVAPVARQALSSPARLHDAAGQLAGQVWTWLGRPWIEQMMVREVVKRLPVLGEKQAKPLARAAQLAGIRLCYEQGKDLTSCPCFVDLVENEGERKPRALLDAGLKGWEGLAKLR
jgi:hypothetical protein